MPKNRNLEKKMLVPARSLTESHKIMHSQHLLSCLASGLSLNLHDVAETEVVHG